MRRLFAIAAAALALALATGGGTWDGTEQRLALAARAEDGAALAEPADPATLGESIAEAEPEDEGAEGAEGEEGELAEPEAAPGDEPATEEPPIEEPGPPDDRDAFGVVVIGSTVNPDSLPVLLDQLRVRWWYAFDERPLEAPGYTRLQLVRVGGGRSLDPAALEARAAQAPGSAWLIGNEPNVGGQDDVAPEEYAALFKLAADALRSGDPTAVLVAPNVLNWDALCEDTCGWDRSGRWFVDGFRRAYQEAYGEEPPVDVWGVHVYELNWSRLPMDDHTLIAQELEAFRAYLDEVPAHQGKPIWLTEFGVIWAYDGMRWEQRPDGSWRQLPEGTYRADRLEQYVRETSGWLRAEAERLGIARWFLYGTFPPPEPYTTAQTGLALFEGPEPSAPLSPAGRAYAELE